MSLSLSLSFSRRMMIADQFLELDLTSDSVIAQFFGNLGNQPVFESSAEQQASMEASEE